MERLHCFCSTTSSLKSVSSAGGSSFLLLLLQPAARMARASNAACFQRITSRIPFGQVVQLDLQATDRSFRSEEHTSQLQSLMRISYAVFSWKKIQHHTE